MTIKKGRKQLGAEKMSRLPVKFAASKRDELLAKPPWIRAQFPGTPEVIRLKKILRENNLHTVCEEASCPNLGECFSNGTATFMIMGDICTRRCPFCDVAHGRPGSLDTNEPANLSRTIQMMGLDHVVITSVDRDDLRDGGASHFRQCIEAIRTVSPKTTIEILIPDFRGRATKAIEQIVASPPDILNHNLETVPRLYKRVRPGASYEHSLQLLKDFGESCPNLPTKSGLMLGVGESIPEVEAVMEDLRGHGVELLTLGQYLQPSLDHLPVERYVNPQEFLDLATLGSQMGFGHVASGPMVRSSYHADRQARPFISPKSKPTKLVSSSEDLSEVVT